MPEKTCGNLQISIVLLSTICTWMVHAEEYLQVRLTGGSTSFEGLVQVYYNGQWGMVCDDQWDIKEGIVVCRQLGYSFNFITHKTTDDWEYAVDRIPPNTPIHLDDMLCTGNEPSLGFCLGNYGYHNCDKDEYAGVICALEEEPVSVRLQGGSFPYKGRLEVYYQDQWGTVCDDMWDITDAKVACRQLGYYGSNVRIHSFDAGTGPILLDDADCDGTELRLQDCYGSWGLLNNNCDHTEDVGIICDVDITVPVRLVDSLYPNQGRVEIYIDNSWGTICDDSWDIQDAQVVCNQLGFDGASSAEEKALFGQGTDHILFDEVNCNGYEKSIFHCDYLLQNNCGHSEDAGVVCNSERYPSYAVPDTESRESESTHRNYFGRSIGLTVGVIAVVGVVITFCLLMLLCVFCHKACRKEPSTTAIPVQVNDPFLPPLDTRAVTRPIPNTGSVPLMSAYSTGVTRPSAPDLPPDYDRVMKDPGKFGFPPGPTATHSAIAVPITPPPEYTPEADTVSHTDV